ncbi:trimeric intracellular cation channel family protein [Novosphingobium sp. Chol11]|uniref:trimeric intracellular cation channel family protein n=1 Tax=Novosphingobium sp. Chol11 TaxID=1385763 RepID=UPI0025E2B568|nr:trimeric intracellular cation channel family protein [Novosphingobium sp. Chol11]
MALPLLPASQLAILPPADLVAIFGAADLAGIAVCAISGALLAAQLRQTFVTMAFFALITGVGGGSVRDLLIGAPVFWVRDQWVAPVCLSAALLVWFTPRRWWEGALLDWADAAGLGAYAVLGTAKALAYGVAPVPAMLMGVITGCVGGVIRDVLAARPSIVMRPEIYVTAAALAAALCAGGTALGLPNVLVWPVAAFTGFGLRGAAIRWKLAIPSYAPPSEPAP